MGLRRIDTGTIKIHGQEVTVKKSRDAVNLGIGYLSEDRQGKGIVQDFTIPENISLISLQKYMRGPLIDKVRELEKSEEYVKTFNIVAASKKLALRYLSGGNQQKVYLSRWVDTDPKSNPRRAYPGYRCERQTGNL